MTVFVFSTGFVIGATGYDDFSVDRQLKTR